MTLITNHTLDTTNILFIKTLRENVPDYHKEQPTKIKRCSSEGSRNKIRVVTSLA